MKRALRYAGRVHKDLNRLDADIQARILSALERFAATGDGDVRPLRGESWRAFMRLEAAEIVVYQIDNRGEAY